jgi:hypothetical protein
MGRANEEQNLKKLLNWLRHLLVQPKHDSRS